MIEEENYLELKEKIKAEKEETETVFNKMLESTDIIAGKDEKATGYDFYKAMAFMQTLENEFFETETLWKKIRNKFTKK